MMTSLVQVSHASIEARCETSVQQTQGQQRFCWLCDAAPATSSNTQEKHYALLKTMRHAVALSNKITFIEM